MVEKIFSPILFVAMFLFRFMWVALAILLVIWAVMYSMDPELVLDMPNIIIGMTLGMTFYGGMQYALKAK